MYWTATRTVAGKKEIRIRSIVCIASVSGEATRAEKEVSGAPKKRETCAASRVTSRSPYAVRETTRSSGPRMQVVERESGSREEPKADVRRRRAEEKVGV